MILEGVGGVTVFWAREYVVWKGDLFWAEGA